MGALSPAAPSASAPSVPAVPAGARGLAYYPVGGPEGLPELAYAEPEAFVRAGWVRAASPRQADLLLVLGPVNRRLAPVVARLAAQVPLPGRVLLVGDCATASYTQAVDPPAVLASATRVPGCPADAWAVVQAAAA